MVLNGSRAEKNEVNGQICFFTAITDIRVIFDIFSLQVICLNRSRVLHFVCDIWCKDKTSAHLFKQPCERFYSAIIFFNIIFLAVHLLAQMDVMLHFICMGSVELWRMLGKN